MYIVRMLLGGQVVEVVAAEMLQDDFLAGMVSLKGVEDVNDDARPWLGIHSIAVRNDDIVCVFEGDDTRDEDTSEDDLDEAPVVSNPDPNHKSKRRRRDRNG